MSIDAHLLLRRIKPEKRSTALVARAPALTAASFSPPGAVMLDTNVYILDAAGKLTPDGAAIVDQGRLFHSAVCIAELMVGVAGYSPAASRWKAVRDHYTALIAGIPSSRFITPDDDVWAEAGMVAGLLSRTQGLQAHQRKECLNDALIYLSAAKAGLPVLTENAADFDLIQQVCGRGVYIAL